MAEGGISSFSIRQYAITALLQDRDHKDPLPNFDHPNIVHISVGFYAASKMTKTETVP